MSNVEVSAGGKTNAIHAAQEYVKYGTGASKTFGFTRHVAIAMTAGVGLGLLWKSWHWNNKRQIAQYYYDLSKQERKEEQQRKAAIEAKFKELEQELA